jgi:phosphoglycolate phosphatase
MKLIGIDLDGTLEDSRADMVAAAARVRAPLGLPARDAALLVPHVTAGMDRLYRSCFDDYLAASSGKADADARYRAVREAYDADYLAHVAVETRLYDGVADALQRLAELGTLACVTNKPERISRALLDTLGVGSLFRTVVGGDSCAEIKPSPLMLRTAAERCGFDPHGNARENVAFMIGDTDGDIQLARAFGATSIWCAWGYVARPKDTPDFEARVPADLPGIVRG